MPDCVVGMMVGTSLDGIDAALVEFDGSVATVVAAETTAFSSVDPVRLREIASGAPTTAEELSAVGCLLAHDHATAVERVDPDRQADLVGAHGVTVSHVPFGNPAHGWQLLAGGVLAARTRRDVACDFRSADLALGGQGAPLAPVADLALRVADDEDRIILNLGGISNYTALPAGASQPSELLASDAGPANMILDGFMRRISRGEVHFDDGGALAMAGTPDQRVVAAMLADPWFALARPRSGGREEFGEAWLDRFLAGAKSLAGDADRMASLVVICARAIADQVNSFPPGWRRAGRARVLVTGGGRKNLAVMSALRKLLPGFDVEPIEAIGEDGDAKESVDFAWLALQRRLGNRLGLAPFSGARSSAVGGALYLGSEAGT